MLRFLEFGYSVPTNKEVVIIRHAKSQAQGMHKHERRKSMALLDAKLHDEGVQQMDGLQQRVKLDEKLQGVDIVLCSPLSRAIQTACLTFEGCSQKILLVPELAEFAITKNMSGYENTGRTWKKIRNDPTLLKLDKFKDVDFSLIKDYAANYGEDWWSKRYEPEKSKAQIQRLKKFLLSIPYKKIALVGHCCNFMWLLETFHRVPNCTPIWCKLVVRGDRISLVRKDKRSMKKIAASIHPEHPSTYQ